MSPLVWIVTNGRRGDIVQCQAIARGLSNRIVEKTITPRKPFDWLMPWGPCDPKDLKQFTPPFPDLLIASGRRSVPYAKRLANLSNGQTKILFMKYPGTTVSNFALSWHPKHDQRPGTNIIETLTAPHLICTELLKKHRQEKNARLAELPTPRLGVLIGGNTKSVTYTSDMIEKFCSHLEGAKNFASLAITTSRRTPPEFVSRLKKIKSHPCFIWSTEADGPNPYVDILANCDAFIVSGDSHNLVSEALAAGRKTYVFNPPTNPEKFQFTLRSLVKSNKIKLLPTDLEAGEQPSFDETGQIIELVRQHFTFQ